MNGLRLTIVVIRNPFVVSPNVFPVNRQLAKQTIMRLLFLHIPKAGGTTFHAVLENLHPNKNGICSITPRFSIQDFINLPKAKREEIDLLKGHFEFGMHQYFEGGDFQYITLFRKPVERVISHYYYVLRTPQHYLYHKVAKTNMSLLDYATSDLTTELDNGQLRLLTGSEDPAITCTPELLEKAKENLRKYFVSFGIVEEFDKSLILFKNKMGWEDFPVYKKLNVTKKKPQEIPQEVRAAIEERNRFDMELYAWAREEFAKSCSTVPAIEEEVKILKYANKAFAEGYMEGLEDGKKALFKKYNLFGIGSKLSGALRKVSGAF